MLLSDTHLYGILRLQRAIFSLCFHPYSHTINLYIKFLAKRYLLCTCMFYDSSELLLKSEVKLYTIFLFLTCLTTDTFFVSYCEIRINFNNVLFIRLFAAAVTLPPLRFPSIFRRLYGVIVSHPGHVGSSSFFLSFHFSNRAF
jgi:hypothetical protein